MIFLLSGYKTEWEGFTFYKSPLFRFGVSLGDYIIIGKQKNTLTTLRHEHGHQLQSQKLGWLYLIVIGIPSLIGNLYDIVFHRKWSVSDRIKWYYNQPWEAWADKLGQVERN